MDFSFLSRAMSNPTVPRRAIFMLAALTLVWGTAWPLFPYAMREMSVWTFRSIALFGAGSMLLLTARIRGESLVLPRKYWITVIAATLFYLVIWNIASTHAATLIPSGQAAVLGFTMPLWGALISWAILGERLSGRLLLAIVLGGLGVALLMVPGFAAYADAPVGFALGLIAGIGWAAGTIILKRGNVQVPILVLTGWQLLIGFVPIGIVALLVGDGHWFVPSWQSIAVIAWITVVPMSIGNVCWFFIVGLLPANIAGLSSVMVPIVAMITGAIVNGEPLGLLQLASMAMCVGALVLALGQKKK